MSRVTKTLTVSLPPQIYKEVEKLAKQGRKTRSELFRDMVTIYPLAENHAIWRG